MLEKLKYYVYSAAVLLNMTMITLAQDTKHEVDINVDVKGVQWYNQWWIWVIVAGFFMITIVALLTRSRRTS
jgi:hypothetical protein